MAWKHLGKVLRVTTVGILGILPATGVLLWAIWIRTPLYRQLLERQLTLLMDHPVHVAVVEYPRPHSLRLKGFSLGHPGAEPPALYVDELLWTTKRVFSPANYGLQINKFLLNFHRFGDTQNLFRKLSENVSPGQPRLYHVVGEITHLEFTHRDLALIFPRGQLELASTLEGQSLLVRLWPAGETRASPVEIRFVRSWGEKSGVACGFHSGPTELPCSFLGLWFPGFLAFGSRASFRGYVWYIVDETGQQAELSGRFIIPSPNDMLGGVYAGLLHGDSELWVEKAQWRNGHWRKVTGVIRVAGGQLHSDLLQQWWSALKLRMVAGTLTAGPSIPFEELRVRFDLEAGRLWLEPGFSEERIALVGKDFVCSFGEEQASFFWPYYLWLLLPQRFRTLPYPTEFAAFVRSLGPPSEEGDLLFRSASTARDTVSAQVVNETNSWNTASPQADSANLR